jgi:hypothetical protein
MPLPRPLTCAFVLAARSRSPECDAPQATASHLDDDAGVPARTGQAPDQLSRSRGTRKPEAELLSFGHWAHEQGQHGGRIDHRHRHRFRIAPSDLGTRSRRSLRAAHRTTAAALAPGRLGPAVFDFSVAADREQAYQVVLLEAGTVSDLEQWLDGDELLRLWPALYLPRVLRAAWQDRHPALVRVGAGPHVPQLSSCRSSRFRRRLRSWRSTLLPLKSRPRRSQCNRRPRALSRRSEDVDLFTAACRGSTSSASDRATGGDGLQVHHEA